MKSTLNKYSPLRKLRNWLRGSWLTEGLVVAVILMIIFTLVALRIAQLEMHALSHPHQSTDRWKITNIALEVHNLDHLALSSVRNKNPETYEALAVRLEVLASLLMEEDSDKDSASSLLHSLPESKHILEKLRMQIDQWSYQLANTADPQQTALDISENVGLLVHGLRNAVLAVHIASSIEQDKIRVNQHDRLATLNWILAALLIGIAILVMKLILDRQAAKRMSKHLELVNKRLESRVERRTRQLAESKELLRFILDASPSEAALVGADTGEVMFINKTLLDRMGRHTPPDTLFLKTLLVDRAVGEQFLDELDLYGRVDNLEAQIMPDNPYWSSLSAKLVEIEGKLAHLLWAFDVSEHRKLMSLLEAQANTDAMTQLYNRRAFYRAGEKIIDSCKRYNHSCCLLMLDIDHFKHINDTYGHAAGDLAICMLSDILRTNLRDADIIGRMGGEEFAVLLPHTDMQQALDSAERLRLAVAQTTISSETETFGMTLSIGTAVFDPLTTETLELLLIKADKALYRAKQAGRNRVES
ncbi:GGDEF domain-containing protein [Pseudomonas sp. TTU2014-080ASC]|uniref:GGDEF domain-containing protein n=1 Tax=Pseudomonas sp. TTU2014-080ASC TaxID=1729724 RepID=UPI0009EA92FD|nr:GGDEF domain-containing protein [Pseudomonas sp. TTU2014-080ASC]